MMKYLLLVSMLSAPILSASAQQTEIKFIRYKNYLIPIEVIKPPAVPTGLSTTEIVNNNTTISWNASPEAEFYELELFNTSTNQWQTVYSGTGTSYTKTNLTFSSNKFRVRACVTGRCSLASNIVDARPEFSEGYPGSAGQCPAPNFD